MRTMIIVAVLAAAAFGAYSALGGGGSGAHEEQAAALVEATSATAVQDAFLISGSTSSQRWSEAELAAKETALRAALAALEPHVASTEATISAAARQIQAGYASQLQAIGGFRTQIAFRPSQLNSAPGPVAVNRMTEQARTQIMQAINSLQAAELLGPEVAVPTYLCDVTSCSGLAPG